MKFQLTRLVRGVTGVGKRLNRHFGISTHTPRERRDIISNPSLAMKYIFQLTRLVRGVTVDDCEPCYLIAISTHTPRERRDTAFFKACSVS